MFQILHDILRIKRGESLTRKDFKEQFNLYMVQRHISMSSDNNVELLNSSVNILYKTLTDEQHYMLLERMLPRTNTNGKYIKVTKKKKPTKKSKEVVDVSGYFEESSSKIDDSLAFVMEDKYKEK